jgi:hypothetical protein
MGNESKDKIEPEVKELRVSVVDIEECRPKPSQKNRQKWFASSVRRVFNVQNKSEQSPWPKLIRRLLYLFSAALLLGIFAVV